MCLGGHGGLVVEVSHRCGKFWDPPVLMSSPYFICYRHLWFFTKKIRRLPIKQNSLIFLSIFSGKFQNPYHENPKVLHKNGDCETFKVNKKCVAPTEIPVWICCFSSERIELPAKKQNID